MIDRRYNWLLLLLFSVVFTFLQAFYSYHFFYIEQFQLFIFTNQFLQQFLAYPGGLVEYLGLFTTQFFILPFVGPAITALLITLLFHLSATLFRKILADEKSMVIPSLLAGSIAISSVLLCPDFNFYIQGMWAFIFCTLFLLISVSIRNRLAKVVFAFFAVPTIYWFAGSISLLFAAVLSIIEIQQKSSPKWKLLWMLFLVWAILISYAGVRLGYMGEFRMSFLPDMYYQPHVKPNVSLYFPWILLTVFSLIIPILNNVKWPGKLETPGIGLVILMALIGFGSLHLRERKFYEFQKLDYFARNKKWDQLIREQTKSQYSNYLLQNYLNLAHAEKNQLIQNLFNSKQHGIQGLKVEAENIRLVAALLSDVSFCVGDIASAQEYAFDGNQTCRGAGSGRFLKRLAETVIIFKNKKVARKYLSILENSWFYADWAKEQLANLDAPSANDANYLVEKQKCMPAMDSREFVSDFPIQLRQLCQINSENHAASAYLQAWYLLSKKIENLSEYLDLNSEIISGGKELPGACQQALLAYFETSPDQWAVRGITTKTVSLYRNYKSFLKNHRNEPDLRDLMKKEFGNTYWFYLQFN